MTFDQPYNTRAASNSKSSNYLPDLQTLSPLLVETDKDKSSQQQSVICGLFTQIMVNPMLLQDRKYTAWLDTLVKARRNRQDK